MAQNEAGAGWKQRKVHYSTFLPFIFKHIFPGRGWGEDCREGLSPESSLEQEEEHMSALNLIQVVVRMSLRKLLAVTALC